jgi:hypothetical protein
LWRNDVSINDNIISQYQASLDMLKQAIVKCPDALWDDPRYKNVFWRVAYHALFFTHLYLQPGEQAFVPWTRHKPGYEDMKQGGEPYNKAEMLEYLKICRGQVEEQVAALVLEAPSGFEWLRFNKLETQFYNLRHLQHHVGELCERLGAAGEIEVDWS